MVEIFSRPDQSIKLHCSLDANMQCANSGWDLDDFDPIFVQFALLRIKDDS